MSRNPGGPAGRSDPSPAGGGPATRRVAWGDTDRYERVPGAVMPARPEVPVGEEVLPELRPAAIGRYVEFELAGRGGMGSVYRCLDRELARRVALKIVRTPGETDDDPLGAVAPPEGGPGEEVFQRTVGKFLQEARVTAGLEHPGVVPVYEIARTAGGVPFYTMRYVRGRRTLEAAIEAAGGPDGRVALLHAFLKVGEAVDYAHTRGVVHRDLKPANVAIGDHGEVVVLDWGLARLVGRPDSGAERWRRRIAELRKGGEDGGGRGVFGTPGYLSPEAVFGGPEETDERSDVYALGAILYRILTDRLPFDFADFGELVRKMAETDPPPATERAPGVPEALSAACAAALVRRPDRRTPSVRALMEAVRAWERESVGEAEADRLLREARKAWDGSGDLEGVDLLARVEQVLARTARILELRPGHPDALPLAQSARAGRLRAMETLSRGARRGFFR